MSNEIYEEPKRLKPKPEILIRLFAKSSNKCSFPDCSNNLFNRKDKFIGHAAHIEGVYKDTARHRKHMTNEERRAEPNLILLCPSCHVKADNDEEFYTVELLNQIKNEHQLKTKDGCGLNIDDNQVRQIEDSIIDYLEEILRILKKGNSLIRYSYKPTRTYSKKILLKQRLLGITAILGALLLVFLAFIALKHVNHFHPSLMMLFPLGILFVVFVFINKLSFLRANKELMYFTYDVENLGYFQYVNENGDLICYQMHSNCNIDGCDGDVYLYLPPEREENNNDYIGKCRKDKKRHTYSYSISTHMGERKEFDFRPLIKDKG